jgi:hypothetical protein
MLSQAGREVPARLNTQKWGFMSEFINKINDLVNINNLLALMIPS